MKQQALLKRTTVVLEKPQTLRSVLKEKMVEQGLDLAHFDKVASTVLFNVEGMLSRNFDIEVKEGAKVELIPAVAGG